MANPKNITESDRRHVITGGREYRVERFAQAARDAGYMAWSCHISEAAEHQAELEKASVIFIWRAAWNSTVEQVIAAAKRKGIPTIFDCDDLMVTPAYADGDMIDGIRSGRHDPKAVRALYENVRRTMHNCDFCVTTTEPLAAEMRMQGRIAFVLPNGFDDDILRTSRAAARVKVDMADQAPFRIGYAAGSQTHQKDLKVAAPAIVRLLRKYPRARLVLFRRPDGSGLVDIAEFPEFSEVLSQIEWREFVPLKKLPTEMARFDVSIAPLEVGNAFCEAKSELKFYEAAIVDVPTVASPTQPYASCIEHGRNGFLAATTDEWFDAFERLIGSSELCQTVARAAYNDVLWKYGPRRRSEMVDLILKQIIGGPREAAQAFELSIRRAQAVYSPVTRTKADILFQYDAGRDAAVTVVVPLYNYEAHIIDALNSIEMQTLDPLDLIVVDDQSTDNSASIAVRWAHQNFSRFNRLVVLRNTINIGLGLTRNVGFDAAETKYIMAVDADNKLHSSCCEVLLKAAEDTGAAFAYSKLQQFGDADLLMGTNPFSAQRFVIGNYIDAMALIAKDAWAACGGYNYMRLGWEDYELWCRLIANGYWGTQVDDVLAYYRVHNRSMRVTSTNLYDNRVKLSKFMNFRHPWLRMVMPAKPNDLSTPVL
jgi:glycosyltransferase involved in cell wall biosynthesis